MRGVLPDRRHLNGHALIEGAIEDAHRALLAQISQEIHGQWCAGLTVIRFDSQEQRCLFHKFRDM